MIRPVSTKATKVMTRRLRAIAQSQELEANDRQVVQLAANVIDQLVRRANRLRFEMMRDADGRRTQD